MEYNGEPGNCTDYGGPEKHGDYTPLVGKYVALASLACAICIGLDLLRSFYRRKPWITSKYYPLNAATLTFLAIAIKIPSDISEVMPGLFDQLAKISGVVLVCISMNHMMPSLGVMSNRTILSNMIALAILVITLFVNIIFQCSTSLITHFRFCIILVSALMLFIFSIFASHALTVVTVKALLEDKYTSQHQEIQNEIKTKGYLTTNVFPVEQLKDYVIKYWLLAITSSSDYTLRSSGMALASAIVTYSLVIFSSIYYIISPLYSQWHEKTKGCYVRSGYKRSSGYVFGIQIAAISFGFIASVLRVIYSEPTPEFTSCAYLTKIEEYRLRKLQDWIDSPLPFHGGNKWVRKLGYQIVSLILVCLVWLQTLVVFLAKLVHLVSDRKIVITCYRCCFRKKPKQKPMDEESQATIPVTRNLDLRAIKPYVLCVEQLEGNRPAKETIIKWVKQTGKWFAGNTPNERTKMNPFLKMFSTPSQCFPASCDKSDKLTKMKHFLEMFSTPSQGFRAIGHIYSEGVPENIANEKLPNCWSLTVVTLQMVITTAFKNTDQEQFLPQLVQVVDEVFEYAAFVDNSCPVKEGSARMVEAAKKVRDAVDLHNKWMDEDLKEVGKGDPLSTLKKLQDMAKRVRGDGNGRSRTLKSIAANCLYKITWTIINGNDPKNYADSTSSFDTSLFDLLRKALADTMGACLLNLPRAIIDHCCSGEFGARENKVRKASIILGETEIILSWLEQAGRMAEYPSTNIQWIDSWYG